MRFVHAQRTPLAGCALQNAKMNISDSYPIYMTLIRRTICFSIGALSICAAAQGQPPAQNRGEVAHLLEYVEHSKCQFNRNGTWYESREARQHLQKKYDYLDRRGLAPDAESFIEKAASQSSVSGQAYEVRCANGKAVPSASWLNDELARFRKAPVKQGQQ
jgi:hypothetical protein